MRSTPTDRPGDDRVSDPAPARRLGWTWFAGADERVLALVPSERSFLQAQGLVILAMAGVTGFAVAVAASGWWNVPITHLLWLGILWTAVICIIDRLIYKSFGTSRLGNLLLAVPRAALSVMLALVLGLPMVQFIFQPSISEQLTRTSAAEQKEARQAAIAFYAPKIEQATAQIAAIERHEAALKERISKFTRLSGCEKDDPSCSRTRRPGCGHWCRYYATQASIARATLERERPLDRKKVATLKAQIDDWRQAQATETRSRVEAISSDQDLLARAQALSAIEKEHPEVTRYILFVLGLFVCLDLVALVMKLSHLFVTGAVYEEVAAALRERDRLEAHRLREQTAVLRARITGEAQTEAGVDQVRVEVEKARRIAEEQDKLSPGHPPSAAFGT
jgi:Domain of unknown function (DUF4407)